MKTEAQAEPAGSPDHLRRAKPFINYDRPAYRVAGFDHRH